MDIYTRKSRWKIYLVAIGLLIVVISMIYTNLLVSRLAAEERKKVMVWSTATERLAQGSLDCDMTLNYEIIASNTTIPLILVNDRGVIDAVKNYGEPPDTIPNAQEAMVQFMKQNKERLQKELEYLKKECPSPIVITYPGFVQTIYYKHSSLLSQLQFYPVVQLTLIAGFIILGYLFFSAARRAEQNQVWVGMAKETAHQLGTPITAILGWIEHLRHTNEEEGTLEILDELSNDVSKLSLIAERFSKIGASPELSPANIYEELEKCRAYMQRRASRKVVFDFPDPSTLPPLMVQLNAPLFEWVIENLLRNALDAMEGQGTIGARVYTEPKFVCIDVTDTGKGIPASKLKAVFQPGYTTKLRGWGLGLSLARRIIESYHAGRIFVKRSVVNEGTTFTIKLPV